MLKGTETPYKLLSNALENSFILYFYITVLKHYCFVILFCSFLQISNWMAKKKIIYKTKLPLEKSWTSSETCFLSHQSNPRAITASPLPLTTNCCHHATSLTHAIFCPIVWRIEWLLLRPRRTQYWVVMWHSRFKILSCLSMRCVRVFHPEIICVSPSVF